MKRSDLKVGEHYAVYHPTEDRNWRRVARVEVLHIEPWDEVRRSSYSHEPRRLAPTRDGKGSKVHALLVSGRIPGYPPMSGVYPDETVVALRYVRSTWADYEAAERERKRQEEEDKVRQGAMSAEWQRRVDAVLSVLSEAGVDLSVGAPNVYGEGSHDHSWRIYMDDMEAIAEVIKKGSS